jgi:hypothetical protein
LLVVGGYPWRKVGRGREAIAFHETPQLGDVEKFPDWQIKAYTSHGKE